MISLSSQSKTCIIDGTYYMNSDAKLSIFVSTSKYLHVIANVTIEMYRVQNSL